LVKPGGLPLKDLRGDAVAFEEVWEGLSFHRRRAVIKGLLDRIIVHPAVRGRNKVDRDRFEPVWQV
jgi:hypothetical protein